MAFGEKHLPDKFWLDGPSRVSLRGKILREVISNSLVHREYSSSKPARLVIEKDCLWADNANRAAFHGLITPENVQPVPKNPIIAAFFKQIGNADELGSGTRNLFRYVRLYSGADPVLDEEDQFKVTIPLVESHNPETTSQTTSQTASQTASQTDLQTTLQTTLQKALQKGGSDIEGKILAMLSDNASMTTSEIASRLALSRMTVSTHIRNLKASGRLVREGGRARGVWKVVAVQQPQP